MAFSAGLCLGAVLLLAAACPADARSPVTRQASAGQPATDLTRPGALCGSAVRAAESRYGLPSGLLFAIGQVESGRFDPASRRVEPWPWTVQAEGRGIYFESKALAVQWVKDAQARGVSVIDTGCMQVNLYHHPNAFETLEDAFDPERNADYAARFLSRLHASFGDWGQATGSYHSQTPTLAIPYRARVDRALGGGVPGVAAFNGLAGSRPPPAPKSPAILNRLAVAWRATLGGGGQGQIDPTPARKMTQDWSILLHASVRFKPRPPATPGTRWRISNAN